MPNGIDLIVADHRLVAELFDTFDRSADGAVIGQVIDALTAHDQAEHAALYPLAAALLDDPELITRAEAAHSLLKKHFDQIAVREGGPLVEAFAELRAVVEEHVADEEQNLLPALSNAATPQQLEQLGARILQAKQRVG